jgi:hypothetical protein
MRALSCAALVFVFASACALHGPGTRAADPLLGTWRVVRYEVWENGRPTEPLGSAPVGYAVFDRTGHVFIQLQRDGDASTFAAYHGPYALNRTTDTLSIRVEGGSIPGYYSTVQVRPFRVTADTLRLGVDGEYQATLIRVVK